MHLRHELTPACLVVISVLGSSCPLGASAPGPPPPTMQRGHHVYVVSPQGPRDGGDFGPHTPGTQTSGLQEAFDACRRDQRDLYIQGGAVPAPFENPGGVYALQTTLRIPWMQDFRCDGGEAVLQYTQQSGDAIVMDSQMSCVYKFGLIALPTGNADGACLRIKPQTAGPDRLVGVVASRFAVNACVGGGSRGLESEKYVATGDGLVLDATSGGIVNNEFFVHEVLGCARGIYLTSPAPTSAVLNNWIRCPFLHICGVHLQLGDPGTHHGVLWNRIEGFVDSQDLEGSIGARVAGRGNHVQLGFLRVHTGVVLDQGAAQNTIQTQNLQGRYVDHAGEGSNRIRSQEPDGLRITTPEFPADGVWIENPYPATLEVLILAPGEISAWQRRESGQAPLHVDGPMRAGQTFTLRPHECVQFQHQQPARWSWRALEY